jgi:hypothetical protein
MNVSLIAALDSVIAKLARNPSARKPTFATVRTVNDVH